MDNIPWIPIAVIAGILVVAGGIIYLVIQSNQEGAPSYEKEQAYEMDAEADLPGEFVNLPEAFKDADGNLAHYGQDSDEGPNTNAHVTREVDYSAETSANSDTGLPPVGGPHWGQGGCGNDPSEASAFCGPVPWGVYRASWAAGSVVHNMEHGGVVVWYNTDNAALVTDMEGWVGDLGDDGAFVVMMPYDDIPDDTVALTAWTRREILPAADVTEDNISDFIRTMNCRFNPEGFDCGSM